MTEQAQIRRFQDMLSLSGTAVVAFAVWSLAKIGIFLALVDEDALKQLLGLSNASLTATVYFSLLAIILIDVGVRAYIGLSARAEGHGKNKSPVYLFFALVVALANASSLIGLVLSTSITSSPLIMIVSILIEATATAALVLVIYSSIRLRNMVKATE